MRYLGFALLGLLALAAIAAAAVPFAPWPDARAASDSDGDGFGDDVESFVGTLPLEPCAQTPDPDDEDSDAWPADFNDDQTVDILDVVRMTPPAFGSCTGDLDYSVRKDFNGDGAINILDIVMVTPPTFGSKCTPLGCMSGDCCTEVPFLGVRICPQTDKLVYGPGEPVQMSLEVTNITSDRRTLSFPSSCLADFTVVSTWNSALHRACLTVVVDIPLAPGESFTWGEVWDQKDDSGNPVGPGDYSIAGQLNEFACSGSACRAPPPGSSYTIRILPP